MGSGHSHWVRGSVPLLSSSTLTPLLLHLPYNLVSGSFYCSTFMNRTNDGRQIGFTALRTTSNVISLGLFFQPSTHTKWTSIVSRPCRKGYSFSQFCNFSVLEASRKIHHRSLAALCEAATYIIRTYIRTGHGSVPSMGRVGSGGSQNYPSWVGLVGSGPVSKISNLNVRNR